MVGVIEYPFDPTLANILFCGLVFLAAGIVKGVIGIGLPLVSVPLLAGMVSPGVAISLLVVPAFGRSDEHTSELQSLMRISYAVFCLKKNKHYAFTVLSPTL